MLVLPSLDGQNESVLEEIQRIHGYGIPLLCVGKTGKLSALFGVRPCEQSVRLTKLQKAKDSELIDNTLCTIFQKPTNAQTLVCADNETSIVSRKGICMSINAPLTRVGVDGYRRISFLGRCQISRLLKEVVHEFLKDTLTPLAVCHDNVGITVFESIKGETCILLVDYIDDDPDKEGQSRMVTVQFDSAKAQDIALLSVGKRAMHKLYDGKGLKAVRLQIRTHEEVLLKIVEN